MTLAAGSRLGPYEILSPLGAGGMGEVYRARDTRLDRHVAIKVLPEALRDDPELLGRFEREARVACRISDPHVVSVFDVGREGRTAFLVTELVDGTDLRAELASSPLPLARAVEIAAQIAEGLAAAHEAGIVHRDLKPENVLITRGGIVKIADFGLAKTQDLPPAEGDDAPTMSSYSVPGVVMGTIGYMSPEQVRGETSDARSDIFSFGSLVYEMLTGRHPFRGGASADAIAAILKEEPADLREANPSIPPSLARIVGHCLEKRAERRFQSARDLAFALRALSLASEPRQAPAVSAGPTRSVFPLPEGTRLSGQAAPVLAISRDGTKLAYVVQAAESPPNLYVSHLDRGETRLIPQSAYAEGAFFSPDGNWIAFAADVSADSPRPGELRVYSFSSGLTQTVCPLSGFEGGCWGEDGAIYFVGNVLEGLRRVPSVGAREEPVASRFRLDGSEGPRCLGYPRWIPGGTLLVMDWDGSALGDTSVLDPSSRELHSIVSSGSAGTVVKTGHLLYTKTDGTLFAAPFSFSRGCVTGPAVAVARDVALDGAGGVFALSDTGTLVFARGELRGSVYERKRLARVGRDGDAKPLDVSPEPFHASPCISPDGRSFAVASRLSGIWIFDLRRGTRARLPPGSTRLARFPVWTSDGEWIVFRGALLGEMGWKVFRQKSDGGSAPEVLFAEDPFEKRPRGFSNDGTALLYEVPGGEDPGGLWVCPIDHRAAARRMIAGAVEEASLSPDGRFVAYQSGEFGSIEVFVQRLAEKGRRVQVSVGGGRSPRWARDGRRIFYFARDRFVAVDCEPKEFGVDCGPPQPLFDRPGVEGYDVAPEGDGFLTVERLPDAGVVRQLELVTGWFAELERLVSVPA